VGGFGSGQRWSKKSVVESCYSIDTATLKRWKLLSPGTSYSAGSFEWGREQNNGASVSYRLTVGQTTGTLQLLYSMKSQNAELDYTVRLVTTACHLGGVRWWFICPLVKAGVACGRRVRKLYLCGKYFGCRHCHNLTYRSSQESDSRVYAMLRNGINTDMFGGVHGMVVTQLGLALKALTLEEKRLDKVMNRNRGRSTPKGNAGES
jgi:hypothetical protein